MSIIRIRKTDKFAQIPNATLQDTRISLEAKGLLCHMLSKPTNWTWHKSQVMAETKTGRDRFDRIWKELVGVGYVQVEQTKERGLKRYNYTLFDSPPTENPCVVEPYVVEPCVENDTTTNTDRTKTDRTKTDKTLSASPEVAELLDYLQAKRLEQVHSPFELTKAHLANFAALLTKRGAEPAEIRSVIDYGFRDDFWAPLIMTPTKFAKHYETLLARMARPKTKKSAFDIVREQLPKDN